jgi:hypothetical protein
VAARVPLPIDYLAMVVNGWEVIGQFMYPADAYQRLFELVRAGLLDLAAITPHAYPLAELPAAIAAAARLFLGALLDDPAGLLEGTGKRGRHVKLRPGRELDAAALGRLIDTAYADIRARLWT